MDTKEKKRNIIFGYLKKIGKGFKNAPANLKYNEDKSVKEMLSRGDELIKGIRKQRDRAWTWGTVRSKAISAREQAKRDAALKSLELLDVIKKNK